MQRAPTPAPLQLAEDRVFFVGGRKATVKSPFYGPTGLSGPGEITVGQMYVHYRAPVEPTGGAMVLVHGANHTGATYETTPDGREGWATYFVRRGHPVYVIDHAGRGRSGFNPTPLNEAIAARDIALTQHAPLYPQQAAWVNFRFGPAFGETFPGMQFPIEVFDDYLAQLVPNGEAIEGGAGEATVVALVMLLERIGPAVLMVHSQSGLYGLEVVRRAPGLVRALVSVEGGSAPLPEGTVAALARVPFVSVWGDFSDGAVGANGDARRNGCIETIRAAKAAGGDATYLLLPERGVPGNSHMLMMDRNNLAIADLLLGWLAERDLARAS